MKNILNGLLIIASIAVLNSCDSGSGSSTARMLKFNLEKGKYYDYEMVMDMDQDLMGKKNTIGLIAQYAINVTDDDGTLKTLDIEYRDFKMKMNMMGQEMNIDASKKPEPMDSNSFSQNPMEMMSSAFSGIIGKKFTMKVSGDGKIQSITGVEEFINSIAESMNAGEQIKGIVLASLKGQFSEEKVKETFAPMFGIYPNKEVKPGDKWTNTYILSSQAVESSNEYTVKSFEGDNAIVQLSSKMEPQADAANPNLAALKLSGTQSGTMTINTTTGLIVDSELTQNFTSTGEMKLGMTGKLKMRGKERK
jgi:Family of unknown function (DUF6263)